MIACDAAEHCLENDPVLLAFFPMGVLLILNRATNVNAGHQPEVDFLHHWAVVWLKLSGKSSLQEKRNLEILLLMACTGRLPES